MKKITNFLKLKLPKWLKAFSMIELVLSLLVISIIFAALSPVISKKAHQMIKVDTTMSVYSATECNKWFNDDCQVCTKNACLTCEKICAGNQYKNIGTCDCENCNTRSAQCISCGAKKCTKCNEGFPLIDGVCSDTRCPTGSYSDGLINCKPCPAGKYCMDGLIYNKNSKAQENSGSFNVAISKYTREFSITSLIGAGGAGGKGNLKMTSANRTESYNYDCSTTRTACMCSYTTGTWEMSNNCCCANRYDCGYCGNYKYSYYYEDVKVPKTCTGTRVVASQAYSSYGGGGGGSGAVLASSVTIPQNIIDSAIGGRVNVVVGMGTNGNGQATSVRVINSSGTVLWSISANGGIKGIDASSGSAGAGGSGGSGSGSLRTGSKGGGGGSNTSNTNSNVQGTQGGGAGSGYGAGGKGGTMIVNQNGKQGEIAPARGSNGYGKINYVQLTR